ncbi:MAG: 30S ribosomal protein S7 [Candidatus Bathyarchaeota archaeon]|nr:30S ribosomal protein S7 [Candidatus Bathyarchaeota archaeon]
MSKSEKKQSEVLLFGKWSMEGIEVQDPGLKEYINLDPCFIPHSGGRHEHQRFRKSKVNVVERLVNNLMRRGLCGGKKAKAIGMVRNALEIINLKTGKNPVDILIRAMENTAPSEDVTRVSYGGVVYPIAVDVSPQRRVDITLRLLANGTRQATFSNPKTIDECLADELIAAANKDSKSYSIKKKDEMERIALSSR